MASPRYQTIHMLGIQDVFGHLGQLGGKWDEQGLFVVVSKAIAKQFGLRWIR